MFSGLAILANESTDGPDTDSLVVLLPVPFLITVPYSNNTIRVWLFVQLQLVKLQHLPKHQAWNYSPPSSSALPRSGSICLTVVCWHESLTAPKWTCHHRQCSPMRRQGNHSINRTKVHAPVFHPTGDDAGQYTFQGPPGQQSTSEMVNMWHGCTYNMAVHSGSHVQMNKNWKHLEEASSTSKYVASPTKWFTILATWAAPHVLMLAGIILPACCALMKTHVYLQSWEHGHSVL